MNTKLRTNAKNDFEKDFFKLMNNSVFGKTMENARKYRDIKLVTDNERRNKLVSEPNYHTRTQFSKNLLAIAMKKTNIIYIYIYIYIYICIIYLTLKRVRDMTRTYSQMHRTDKYSEHSSIIWPVWPNS